MATSRFGVNLGLWRLSCSYQRLPAPNEYSDQRQRLLNSVLSAQRPDGSFQCRTDSMSISDDGTSQDFFPGEALMALATELSTAGADARQAMMRAFPWYRTRFRLQPTTGFVLWQIDAWTLYAEWLRTLQSRSGLSAESCGEFVFEMADWRVKLQVVKSASHPDLRGGFALSGQRPDYSSATYTEAVIRAFAMAELLGAEQARRYREAALHGV